MLQLLSVSFDKPSSVPATDDKGGSPADGRESQWAKSQGMREPNMGVPGSPSTLPASSPEPSGSGADGVCWAVGQLG